MRRSLIDADISYQLQLGPYPSVGSFHSLPVRWNLVGRVPVYRDRAPGYFTDYGESMAGPRWRCEDARRSRVRDGDTFRPPCDAHAGTGLSGQKVAQERLSRREEHGCAAEDGGPCAGAACGSILRKSTGRGGGAEARRRGEHRRAFLPPAFLILLSAWRAPCCARDAFCHRLLQGCVSAGSMWRGFLLTGRERDVENCIASTRWRNEGMRRASGIGHVYPPKLVHGPIVQPISGHGALKVDRSGGGKVSRSAGGPITT
ncbi:hypothetical protein C8R47DRAFT_571662 [Mycena vitilis]|nr:hypothetical protein C8R47DRAFT_571662 [Mycena vitilis]